MIKKRGPLIGQYFFFQDKVITPAEQKSFSHFFVVLSLSEDPILYVSADKSHWSDRDCVNEWHFIVYVPAPPCDCLAWL